MSTTLQDLDEIVQDYCENYSTGTLREDIRYRAINRSIEYLKRVLTIPTDEEKFTFWFTEDQIFYNLPSDFLEALMVKYHNDRANYNGNGWDYFDYPTVLQSGGNLAQRRWSITNINGRKQLVMVGTNGLTGVTLLEMDSLTDVTVGGDASGLSLNVFDKVSGTAAIQFDVTNSTGVASVVFSNLNLDLEELFERKGFLKFYAKLTDNNIDGITLKVLSSTGNYYIMTATTADNGEAFATDEWQKIGFHTLDAVATGTPDLNNITEITIELDLNVSFTSAADFLIDKMFTAFPEKMDLIMLTTTKGYDADGVTEKQTLDEATDILLFSGEYDDYADLIGQRAAIRLYPQLRGDKESLIMLKQDFNENLKTYARRYPRKRLQGQFRHVLKR